MIQELLQQEFFLNKISDYLLFLAILIVGLFIVRVLKRTLINRLRAWAENTETTVDDFMVNALEKRVLPLAYYGVFYLGIQGLTIAPFIAQIVNYLGLILLTLIGVGLMVSIINYSMNELLARQPEDVSKRYAIRVISTVVKIAVWVIAALILMDNFGIRISALVAGLGIGGVAVALASQAILGDLFSYFTIFFDRPFELGDFIIIGDFMGTVEHIGIKTTRLRSIGGEQLIFSNTDLTSSRVKNYKRMEIRRVLFRFGVRYETSHQQLQEIPSIVREIITSLEKTRFDRTHFASFGAYSLDYEVVYYVLSSDYAQYMDIQQSINLEIYKKFQERGIEFAYPTQLLHLEK